jgi:U3 small nucleolar ribonucleoprotein protein IMP4
MNRRFVRMRKEYLQRKGEETKNKSAYSQKEAIRKAVAAGKMLPTELRGKDRTLRASMAYDDAITATAATSTVDDEYAMAGLTDPKILITSSRDPSSRLATFIKELKLVFPNSERINRGKHDIQQIMDAARGAGFTDVVIAHENRGEPDGLVISHLPYGPTAYFTLQNTVLRHDMPEIGPASSAYPHIILDALSTPLGHRVGSVLKHLFPVPKDDSRRVITFANRGDVVVFRHHTFATDKGTQQVVLSEAGPRFEMKPYRITLGTLEMKEAEAEWQLHAFMNSHRRRQYL